MIDANEIGRTGYKLFRETAMVPDKDKHELSFKEIADTTRCLRNKLKECTKYAATSKQNMFNCFIISAVIAYLNNCDLNLFMKIDEKLQIESELI